MIQSNTQEGAKVFRKNAMKVINSVVDKGMDEASKIQVILGLQYLDMVESFQMKYRNINSNTDDEEQQEEEEFFTQVSDSVFRVG